MQLSRLSRFIFISLLFCFSNAQASWWSKFVNMIEKAFNVTTPTYYFGDPDNPGINGGTSTGGTYSKALPPYNRKAGRGSSGTENNCLYQFNLPGDFDVYQKVCAQDPGDNSATKHKIKMRNVVCFGGCWAETFELDALKGQCNFFSTKYLIISKRVCARIASPPGDGYSADPGYMEGTDSAGRTRGQYLDTYGVSQWDNLVADQTGAEYAILRPKICAYDDPWALDLWTVLSPSSYGSLLTSAKNLISGSGDLSGFLNIPLDVFDLNPIAQPFHGGSGVTSPVANLLITLLEFYQTYQLMGPQMLELIISMLASAMGISTSGSKFMDTLFKVVNFILTYEVSIVLAILKANSQVNKYAYADYGCVNIPLGDYPPNYCPTSASVVTGIVDSICSTDSSGNVYQNCYGLTSTQTGQTTPYNLCSSVTCVQSNSDNNFLNNTVRIGYTHPVQMCSTSLTSNCVNISASLTRTSAMTGNNFVLGSALSLVNVGNVTISSTKQYRVLYQVLNSDQTNVIEVSNYSYVDLPDCGSTTNGYSSPTSASVVQSTQFCQSIWGVDLGEYSDSFTIAVNATTTAPSSALSTYSSAISLPYVDIYTGASSSKKFYIQINQETEDYNDICAYQTFPNTGYSDLQIGYVPRADIPTATVASCSTSTHVAPCATVSWTATGSTGTSYTASGTMQVSQFTSDWSSLPSDPVVYLGGASFTPHIVNSSNLTIPYQPTTSSDTHIVSYNGTVLYDSMWGNYLDGTMPSSSCDQDTCAIYIDGLEYIGGHYVRGGSYLCIDNTKGCQNDTTQCILAKNYTALDGSSTWTSISPSDRITPSVTTASLSSSDYYTYDSVSTLPSNENVRSKIGLENSSMCVSIPPATCSASTDADTYYSDWSSGTNYYYKATWPASSSTGALATGSCSTYYVPVDSSKMSRYCFLKSTGTASWDTTNSRVSSTFGGCVFSCVNSITISPSNGSSLSGGGNITVQNNSTSTLSADGGNILIYSTGGAGTNGISGAGTNTITINFTVPSSTYVSQADIYFTSLQFADYIQVYVNGTEITTDSSTIAYNSTSYALWNSAASPTDVGGWRNYTTLDTNLSNLNAAMLAKLQSGSNTITINVKTVSGGGFYIGMAYNQLCYTQCSSDGAGYATWTTAAVGGTSAGTCNSGYVALDSSKMSRYCALSSSSGVLDTVSTVSSTVSGTSSNSSKGTSFGGCVWGSCSAVSSASSSTGYATWSSANYNSSSTGTCMTNYVANNSSKMSRSCTIENNAVTLETIQANGTTSSGNFLGCTLGSCSGETNGNATWTAATAGSSSSGTCSTNYVANNTSKMSRSCTVSNNVASLETITNGVTSSGNFLGCSLGACSAVTTASSSTGYATWAAASAGGSSAGTCTTNYVANNTSKMSRSCTVSNNTASLETITNGVTSSGNFLGCSLGSCSAVTTASSSTGYATWTAASAGASSTGTCTTNYIMNNSSKMSRSCTVSNNTASLETITNGVTSSGNFLGCSLGTCSNDSAGYATWTTANAGSLSTGTCNSGYTAAGSMTRYCNVNAAQTSTYLDTVSTNGTNSGTSSGSGGASFAGCVADRVYGFSWYLSNTGAEGCNAAVYGYWSGTTYYISMWTCYGAADYGVLGTAANQYRITFYVPTSAAKATVSMNSLVFNDYVRVFVDGGNTGTFTQVTTDSTSVNGTVLYKTSGDVYYNGPYGYALGFRTYADASGGLSALTTAVRNKLVAGAYNTVKVEVLTFGEGGVAWSMSFANPSGTLSTTGTVKVTTTSPQGGS